MKTKRNYKIRFERFSFNNRWNQSRIMRSGDWVILGVQEWWAGPESFCYKICVFGFDLHIWFTREYIKIAN